MPDTLGKIQPYNLSRRLAKKCKAMLAIPATDNSNRLVFTHMLDLHFASEKFQLPDNAKVVGLGSGFKALDGQKPLRLPFPYTAFETRIVVRDTVIHSMLIYAREQEDIIRVSHAIYDQSTDSWAFSAITTTIPMTDYLMMGKEGVGIKTYYSFMTKNLLEEELEDAGLSLEDDVVQFAGYASHVVTTTLNALACSNIDVERALPKKSGKVKACLPFDTYYTLVVKVPRRKGESEAEYQIRSRRSPREHLRRGHIRKLDDKCIWINSMVICAGAKGKITKDYLIAV